MAIDVTVLRVFTDPDGKFGNPLGVVDASTVPAKRESYRCLLTTEISTDPGKRATQLDENPGLWLRLNPNVRSLILSDGLES